MSPLGKAVAGGEEVASLATGPLYPGVVWRDKTHPALKADVRTTEAGEDGLPKLGGKVRVYDQRNRQLSYEQIAGLTSPGKGPYLAAVGVDGAGPFVTSGGVQPLVEAILFRVFKDLDADEPRIVDPTSFTRATELADSDILLGRFLRSQPTVLKIIEYIRSNPSPRRRKQLLKAWQLWDERGEHSKDWDEINAFVKQENLPWFSPKNGVLNSAVKQYVARLIQAPHDETHLVAGRYLKPLVHELKCCWHKNNWIFYGSASPATLNEWLQRIKGCQSYFWSDYSAFDATFSKETWTMIEGFYRRIYPEAEDDFWRVLDIWRQPKGRMKLRREGYRVEYDAGICNCSGRDDTSLANALFNGVALSVAFASALAGKPPRDVTVEDMIAASQVCKISVMGDDSLVGCDFDVSGYTESIITALKSFGLKVKAEYSRNLHDVTYLGMMPYASDSGVGWGPTIGRRLYKLFWMTEMKSPAAWTRGVCQQMKHLRNVPILYELAHKVDSLLLGKSITRQAKDNNRPWHYFDEDQPKWDETTVHWLCKRYRGLTPSLIEGDLKEIQKIKRLPAVVRLPGVEAILQQDDL